MQGSSGSRRSGPEAVAALVAELIRDATAAGLTVAAAESLTGGLVCAELVQVPGASAVLQGGVVAYQNSVKSGTLGVDADLLAAAGSVDPDVARQMAAGVRRLMRASIGISTTGAAGPEPHDGKPVGTVFIGLSAGDDDQVFSFRFSGSRDRVRQLACAQALTVLQEAIAEFGRR